MPDGPAGPPERKSLRADTCRPDRADPNHINEAARIHARRSEPIEMSVSRATERMSQASAGTVPTAAGRLGRRWRVLVNWREQLRGSTLSLGFAAVLLVVLNVSLYVRRAMLVDGVAHTELATRRAVEQALISDTVYTVVLSAVFMIGIVLVKLIETHRVEGPVINLARRIKDIEEGHYRGVARLRKGDRLGPLAESLNSMVLGIRERARQELKELEELALRAKRVDSKYAAKDLSKQIESFAERTRQKFE